MVTGGRLEGDPTSFTIPKGSVESDPIRVHRPTHSFDAVTVDIGTLPSPPSYQQGYALEKSGTFPLEARLSSRSPVWTPSRRDARHR